MVTVLMSEPVADKPSGRACKVLRWRGPLYLKECEWRFNYRPANRLLATLKTWLNELDLSLSEVRPWDTIVTAQMAFGLVELDPGLRTIGPRCETSCSVATDGARNDEVTQEV